MFPGIGPLEIGIVLLVVVLLFGAKRLPEVGSSLGRGIRDFAHGLKGEDEAAAGETKREEATLPRS